MATYRQQTPSTLTSTATCPSCGPPPQACGAAVSIPSGQQGYYNLDFDAGNTSSDTGAIIIYFNPQSVPDGIRVLYDGVYYNTLTNNGQGRLQTPSGVTGAFTILGTSGNSCVPAAPDTRSYDFYDGIANGAWNDTGTTQSITINAGDYLGNDAGESRNNTLVIPKTSATPNIVSIQVLGPCSGTAWSIAVSCPADLKNISASAAQSTDDCQATQNTTIYFADNHGDSNSIPIVGNFVFTDINGATPLNNTSTVKYYISGNSAFKVELGVITAISTCTAATSYTSYEIQNGMNSDGQYEYVDTAGTSRSEYLEGFGTITICAVTNSLAVVMNMSFTDEGSCN